MTEQRKPKIKEKGSDVEKRRDFERSHEVEMMLILMRRYPDKAKEAARKLGGEMAVSC